jgi:hypothetical protein
MSHAQDHLIEFESPDAEVTAKLEEYAQTRDPLALMEAADAAALHDGEIPPDPLLALRLARQRVVGWLAILEIINEDLDADFNPEELPPSKVSPPPDASGTQLWPGVSPNEVKDPAARQAYIELIEQNRAAIANFVRALDLAEAQSVIIEMAERSLLDAHTTLGLPLAEISALTEAADIRPDDRAVLVAALS